ncbi:DUF3164 family protein [Psychrobacter sp. FDAARGOS_221]|uniref:DUF3164 family protein n=1 Tax=Psychrobacter sp. FDAARGOS_221 TaxID=1975705 RepID=UPI000BB5534F|nr:DUF3164 family protein [Psychrobacter sp. FDAARGOS_221]PNK59938.1 DUF3164 domain-containing protein [Psychrobacter sp. FDAARGOS_221]
MTHYQEHQEQVPAGYMLNEKGYHVPIDKIKPIDRLRDEQVKMMIKDAKHLRGVMQDIKASLFADFRDFLDLSAAEYDTEYGGKKGNVSLPSFDGKYKVQIAIQDHIVFDERLQIAQNLIHACIEEWGASSAKEIMTLVNDAFQVDKEGKVSTQRVLGLRRHNFEHPKWEKAMEAIADAMQVTSSTEYMRFYERDEHGKYHQISLDFSKV